MEWIKVTPETMPPHMEDVKAKITYSDGFSITCYHIRWDEKLKKWKGLDPDGSGEFVEDPSGEYITHWMPIHETADG